MRKFPQKVKFFFHLTLFLASRKKIITKNHYKLIYDLLFLSWSCIIFLLEHSWNRPKNDLIFFYTSLRPYLFCETTKKNMFLTGHFTRNPNLPCYPGYTWAIMSVWRLKQHYQSITKSDFYIFCFQNIGCTLTSSKLKEKTAKIVAVVIFNMKRPSIWH